MELNNDARETVINRLVAKLPSVHPRLKRLKLGKTEGEAKKKLHQVLHSGYRTKKAMQGAMNEFEKLVGLRDGAEYSEANLRSSLEGKGLKKLQRLDRLVKPDPRIYVHKGEAVSFDDIKTLGRSPIEAEIQRKITAVNLETNPEQLIKDLEKYGFSVISTDDVEKERIANAFQEAENYLKSTDLASKKHLSLGDPSIDAEYRSPKIAENGNSGYRPMENIVSQRPFIYSDKYSESWKTANALDLRVVFQDLSNLLESKSLDILSHLESLFKLPSKLFSEHGNDTDQSTLRLIHCISEAEQRKNSDKYFDVSTKAKSFSKDEPDDSCVGIHTDWGLITLLPTATAQGLEFWYNDVENDGKNSGWVKLDSKPGELIVMPGNIAEIISGGKLKSVPHRVISEGDRLSYAYFTELAKDANVDNLKEEFVKAGVADSDKTSLFEDEMRPYLVSPDQALTGENYLMYMKYRNSRDLPPSTINYARKKGLFLTN